MKIAIVGAGLAGIACAIECERFGVVPDIYERDRTVGWIWPSAVFWPKFFYYHIGDPIEYAKKNFNLFMSPLAECKKIVMKSPNKETIIEGDLGYFIERGKGIGSEENQLLHLLNGTVVHYNQFADYNELSKRYDWVIIATGDDVVTRELGLWEDQGTVNMMGGIALGQFDENTAVTYMNTEYAGSGYARVTPINSTQAIVKLYDIGHQRHDLDTLFSKFLKYEKLEHLEFIYKFIIPPHHTGRVEKFQVGNILLTGRSAGLIERFLGVGGLECISSGMFAARAAIKGEDYSELIKPLHDHVESLSTFRKLFEKLDNAGYDKLVSILGTPGIQQVLYKSGVNVAGMAGALVKMMYE